TRRTPPHARRAAPTAPTRRTPPHARRAAPTPRTRSPGGPFIQLGRREILDIWCCPDDTKCPRPRMEHGLEVHAGHVDRAAGRVGRLARPDTELLLDLLLDLGGHVGVLLEEVARVLLALPELVAVVGVPGAGLADDRLLDAHV